MSGLTLNRRSVLQAVALAALPFDAWADPSRDLTFLAVGDWGREGAFHQQDVADRMGETASRIGARFVISVGDNFYDDGVVSVDDPAWKTSFEDVYRAPSLQVPWYVALGNHDYRGNSQAQIDYSATSARWRLPARWHGFQQRAPDGTSLEVFVLDTSPFIRGYYADGGVKVKVVGQDVEAQLAWFEKSLSASTADWKIVVGHHPVYSGGRPGGAPAGGHDETLIGGSPDLIARIDPFLQRHGVPLYLNGHNHDLQHIHRGATHYVCTGAGSKTSPRCYTDGSDFCSLDSGFVACAINRDRIEVIYRDSQGATLDVVEIPRTTPSA